ncbi:hypothetical protein ACLS0R_09980, partial [Comamonas jiangduensis]|uniref:hypothetical protein n=1 Tax=Comamonas jiangduensis TaxID=1194168 RepID=UPI003BF7EBA4
MNEFWVSSIYLSSQKLYVGKKKSLSPEEDRLTTNTYLHNSELEGDVVIHIVKARRSTLGRWRHGCRGRRGR